jgi:ribokinase
MGIVVVGSINVDYSVMAERLPKEGETILASSLNIIPGGKGANQAVAAKRLGGNVSMIGAVGNDAIGKKMKENLRENGIDVSGIIELDDVTGTAFIAVSEDGENSIIVYPGANEGLTPKNIEALEDIIEKGDIILIQLEIPMQVVEKTILLAKKYNKKVILNPAPAKEIPQDIYKNIYIITPNETELELLTGTKNIEEGAKKLLDKGVEKVVVTLGSRGCLYMDRDNIKYFNSYKVKVVDTTAAGDTFNAALAIGVDKAIDEMIEFANASAGLSTTKLGAQSSIPYLNDVIGFIEGLEEKIDM